MSEIKVYKNKYMSQLPGFVKHKELQLIIVRNDETERVFIYKLNEAWVTWHEKYYDNEYETGWYMGDGDEHKYDSKETALKELKENYPWAKNKNTIIKAL